VSTSGHQGSKGFEVEEPCEDHPDERDESSRAEGNIGHPIGDVEDHSIRRADRSLVGRSG
jgi:hypothetical protein